MQQILEYQTCYYAVEDHPLISILVYHGPMKKWKSPHYSFKMHRSKYSRPTPYSCLVSPTTVSVVIFSSVNRKPLDASMVQYRIWIEGIK